MLNLYETKVDLLYHEYSTSENNPLRSQIGSPRALTSALKIIIEDDAFNPKESKRDGVLLEYFTKYKLGKFARKSPMHWEKVMANCTLA